MLWQKNVCGEYTSGSWVVDFDEERGEWYAENGNFRLINFPTTDQAMVAAQECQTVWDDMDKEVIRYV